MTKSHFKSGFTLLEMTVVLAIVALVSGMGLMATLGAMESAKRAQTETKLNAIEAALMDFRTRYNRLPCPTDPTILTSSASYGVESTATCTAPVGHGAVPMRTLGLPDEFMYDGWGRKFAYAVLSYATQNNIFELNFNYTDQCLDPSNPNASFRDWAIRVWGPSYMASGYGASAVPRSKSAIYTLVSFGKNGHGAYLANTTRVNAASTNTDEQLNCMCDVNAAATGGLQAYKNFVQKEETQDTANPTNGFDDIVRYKERWQLQNYDDTLNYSNFDGPNLAVVYSSGIAPIQTYRKICQSWFKWNTPITGNVGMITGMGFTPDNKYLFAYSKGNPVGNANGGCYLMGFGKTTTPPVTPNHSAVPGCPVPDFSSQNAVAMSSNGILAITSRNPTNVPPFVYFWAYSNGSFLPMPGLTVQPDSEPVNIAFSKNGMLFATSTLLINSHIIIYSLEDKRYAPLKQQPADVLAASVANTNIAFSPDGKYFIATRGNTVYVWQIGANNIFTPLFNTTPVTPTITLPGAVLLAIPSFSPDSKYLAINLYSFGGSRILVYDFATRVLVTDTTVTPASWSKLAFDSTSQHIIFPTGAIWRLMTNATGTPTPPTQSFQQTDENITAIGSISAAAFRN